MQVILVQGPRRNQQASPLLQHPPLRISLPHPLPISVALLLRVNVQHGVRAERDGGDDRIVCGSVFMREDSLPGGVFVDKDVVWGVVGGGAEDGARVG